MKPPFGVAAVFTCVVLAIAIAVAGQQRQVAAAQAYESPGPVPDRYESPDKAIVAWVFPVGRPGGKPGTDDKFPHFSRQINRFLLGCRAMARFARVVIAGAPHGVTQRGNGCQFLLVSDPEASG